MRTELAVDSEPSRPSFEDALAMAHKQRHKSLAVDWIYYINIYKQYASDDNKDDCTYDNQCINIIVVIVTMMNLNHEYYIIRHYSIELLPE